MNRFVLLTALSLMAIVGGTLCFADDAQAFGHRRGGCAASHASSCGDGYGGWYPGRALFGFERRQARRARRHARYAHAYGCAGAPASCADEYVPEIPTDCPHCPTTAAIEPCPDGVCPAPRL